MKIFVSIPAYQDPLLIETLASAYTKSRNPENLIFGVLDQSDNPLDFKKIKFNEQIVSEHIHPSISQGACWARKRIQDFVSDEEYYLQIDSHMLFQNNWDELLISYHKWIEKHLSKDFIISGYPRSFKIEKPLHAKENIFKMNISHQDTLGIAFREKRLFEDGHFSMQKSCKTGFEEPAKGLLVGAGFIFSKINFVNEIPYDDKLYFHGEELSLALRLFTNDWDVIHIPRTPLFHQYTDVKNLTRKLHWNPDDDRNRVTKWHELDKRSKNRLSELIKNEIHGILGLGKRRTLSEFNEMVGIDLLNKTVVDHERATRGGWIEKLKFKESFNMVEIKNS